MGALAKHYGNRATARGLPKQGVVLSVIGICLGCEIGGIVLTAVGSQSRATGTVLIGAICGFAVGVVLASLAGNAMTSGPLLASEGAQGPVTGPTLGDQLVGEECQACNVPIANLLDGTRCKRCTVPLHVDCVRAHRAKAHPKRDKTYREAASG